MAGSSNISGDESIIFADNASFDGTERGGKMTTNGQLWIGSSVSPHVRLGTLTSDGTMTITPSPGSIQLGVAGGAPVHGTGTDNHIVRWDGTGVPVIQDSPWTLQDNGAFTLSNGVSDILAISTSGLLTSYNTDSGPNVNRRDTATTNAAVAALDVRAETTGVAASGLGPRIVFSAETTTAGTINDSAYIQSTWTNAPAPAGGTSRLSFFASSLGTLSECLRLNPSQNTSLVNFANSNGRIFNRTATAIDLAVTNVMHIIAVTSTAAVRTITLPIGANVVTNQVFVVKDESGAAATNNIIITCSGGATNIDGAVTYTINSNYGSVNLYWNGSQYFTW